MRQWSLLCCAIALSACSTRETGPQAYGPAAHEVAPDFSLKLIGGETFQRKEALGSVLVIDFWATWCAPCRTSMPAIDAIYRKHATEGLRVVSVNEDGDLPKVKAMMAETKISYPVGIDDGAAGRAFGVETMPSAFVIDRRGVVRFVHLGYPPRDSDRLEAEVKQLLAET